MITETFSESDQSASARSVYVALTELASDNGTETFTATKALIAHEAAVSVKTVERILKGLEQLGAVKIERGLIAGAFNAPNTYTLLSLSKHVATLRHGDATLRLEGSRSKSDKVKEKERNTNKPNTGTARSDVATRNVKSKSQRPASPGLGLEGKDSDWLLTTPLHVLKRRHGKYQNERSQLLREYGNGASNDQQKLDCFRRDAPPEVQRRYDWLRPKIKQIEQAIADRNRP